MPKWKTQTVTPATCSDGQCVIWEKFDTLAEPRVVEVVGYKQRCGGHTDGQPFPTGVVQAWDGQWRDADTHLNWERAFYRFATGQGVDPTTPPAGPVPSQAERDGLARAHAWHKRDNSLQQGMERLAQVESTGIDLSLIAWWFEGVGDTRILHVDTNGQLSVQQRRRVEDVIELSFGPGRLVWEG